MKDFEQTDDTATDEQLIELFKCGEVDDEAQMQIQDETVIGVCDGEWRREGPGWRFWRNPERAE